MEKQRVGLSDCELTNGINIEMSTAQVGLFCFYVCLFFLKKASQALVILYSLQQENQNGAHRGY